MGLTDQIVKDALVTLLQTVDWETTSEKQIKAKLRLELGDELAEYDSLIKAMISETVEGADNVGSKRQAPGAAYDSAEQPSKAAKASTASTPSGRTAQAAPSAAGKETAAGDAGAADSSVFIELNGRKRTATVGTYKGTAMVSIREYYEAHGEMRPGKKGISLVEDQFEALVAAAPAVSSALESRDLGFSIPISSKRKVGINDYKGTLLVNIREYYEKAGETLPGAKGISLTAEQWAALQSGLPALQEALTTAQANA